MNTCNLNVVEFGADELDGVVGVTVLVWFVRQALRGAEEGLGAGRGELSGRSEQVLLQLLNLGHKLRV